MVKHFDSRTQAISHLEENGWRELNSGNWVSRDGTCAAAIHPVANSEAVAVGVREITAA